MAESFLILDQPGEEVGHLAVGDAVAVDAVGQLIRVGVQLAVEAVDATPAANWQLSLVKIRPQSVASGIKTIYSLQAWQWQWWNCETFSTHCPEWIIDKNFHQKIVVFDREMRKVVIDKIFYCFGIITTILTTES